LLEENADQVKTGSGKNNTKREPQKKTQNWAHGKSVYPGPGHSVAHHTKSVFWLSKKKFSGRKKKSPFWARNI
jgi:hypothetical protein